MGEFQRMVEGILAELEERKHGGGINPNNLPDLLRRNSDGEWNCYPGEPGGKCCDSAAFFSLTTGVSGVYGLEKKQTKGKVKHIYFFEAIEAIVQHMAKCPKTKTLIFITDNWDAQEFETWRITLEKIQKEAFLEIYLIMGSKKAIKIM